MEHFYNLQEVASNYKTTLCCSERPVQGKKHTFGLILYLHKTDTKKDIVQNTLFAKRILLVPKSCVGLISFAPENELEREQDLSTSLLSGYVRNRMKYCKPRTVYKCVESFKRVIIKVSLYYAYTIFKLKTVTILLNTSAYIIPQDLR